MRQSPKRTKFSREEAPLHAIRQRDAGNGQFVRMVKIRMDGKPGLRWIQFARWWWEQNIGPVPAGKRICHADANLLNDDPANLVALTPGEVFNLYHRLDPEMSRRNHAACGRSAAERNSEVGRIRRASSWLPWQWYGVDFGRRQVHNRPRRKRWMVLHDHGFSAHIADHLRAHVDLAKAGNSDSASHVLQQIERLPNYQAYVRSLSLGWPGVPVIHACILTALADAGGSLPTRAILGAVETMRRDFNWRPFVLTRRVFASVACQLRDSIFCQRGGCHDSTWTIRPIAPSRRLDTPRIIAMRGRDLTHPRFANLERIEPIAGASNRSPSPRRPA